MSKRWVYKDLPDPETVHSLASGIKVSDTLAALLVQRGYSTFEETRAFFRPHLGQLHDPFLMKDMEKAVNRLSEAIFKKEKILIYGDYDVDGTTSVALAYGFLRKYHSNIDYYIPDRYDEGYGISETGVRWAAEQGFTLVIALDCGIKAVSKVELANSLGVDFIICDHHLPGPELPKAFAVLDPKRLDCDYPFDGLSGCGVGFKLMQAFAIQNTVDIQELYLYLDLVAVSIASDIVPVVGENRVLAYFGLQKLNKSPLPGLKALKNLSGIRGDVTVTRVVFGIGPRINAAGRIDHAGAAVELLLARTEEEAEELAAQLDIKNDLRKGFDENITKEALAIIEEEDQLKKSFSTVLYRENWHKGVIGIVASRCIEKFYRPTIILTESNSKATGSARSVVGFDVYEAIAECADLLDQYGGHKYAAGLTMNLDKVEAFKERFEEVVARRITPEMLEPIIDIDLAIPIEGINHKFFNILRQMAPFGPGNMQPVFVSTNVVAKSVKQLKEIHLKMFLSQEGSKASLEAIAFGFGEYYDAIADGAPFNVAYTIEENDFMGNKTMQLHIKDLKLD
ncbi:single-stranded-DNA-specific exonuclease RecJ [uncultured Imperialibacter sp.]|uniref:single-stranded-DNA-specific exonuclease RecJ n=1 Tax=uncultured Imperialibacter sp. TaxID=1672639 RepID=UPI0030D8150E|tara:strand:- start:60816 stop:62516 length:1701 start_codon:yes stop_codon:yes gene_type:complete